MNQTFLVKITNYLNVQKGKSRRQKVFVGLSIIVFLLTLYVLMMPAMTMEEILICLKEEHTHTDDCYGTDSDLEKITYLVGVIDTLPTVLEMNTHLEDLSNQEETEEVIQEYRDEVIEKATNAYSYYIGMNEKLQNHVNNIEKLLEYKDANLISVDVSSNTSVALLEEYTSYGISTIADEYYHLQPLTEADGVVSTKDFIEVNLYDYGTNINDPYDMDSSYPGFQQDGGSQSIWGDGLDNQFNYGFGNNITSEIEDIRSRITYDGSGINVIPDINSALTGTMQSTLKNGYPALANGNSLGYLFGAPFESTGTIYASKQNTDNIDGLFLYNSLTGGYSYDSRKNHAEFDSSNNTFSLYNEIISSNYMMFPFGNFLPFNHINTQTTKASDMGSDDLERIASSALTKYNNGNGQVYNTLSSVLNTFNGLTIDRYGEEWTAGDATTAYFKAAGLDKEITTEDLENNKVYSIDYDEPTNFFFGLEMKMEFMQPKNGKTGLDGEQPMKFFFTGDDDVWVYIDGMLFLDLSGIHRHVGGEIDFVNGVVNYYCLDVSTGDVSTTPSKTVYFSEILGSTDGLNDAGTFEDYSTHTFNFYYMERGAGSGVMRMNFNFPLLKKNSISVTKELSVDQGEIDALGNPDFSFQILKAGEDTTYIPVGTSFEIYEHYDTDRKLIGTGTVEDDGIFKLKAGQAAVFSNIAENSGEYYVREIIDSDWVSQYGQIFVDGKEVTGEGTDASGEFIGFESNVKNISAGSTVFTFNNRIATDKYGSLRITKVLESEREDASSGQFKIQVTLDGVLLPINTKYKVTKTDLTVEERIVTEEGIVWITPGEVVVIEKILAGSNYEVTELTTVINGYDVLYNGNKVSGVKGSVMAESTIEITVTNIETGTNISIPIKKTIANPDGTSHRYQFELTEVTDIGGVTVVPDGIHQVITLNDITDTYVSLENESFQLEYSRPDYPEGTKSHFYKIVEVVPNDNTTKYDESVYVIEVMVTNIESEFSAKVISIYKDGVDITQFENDQIVTEVVFTNHLLTEFQLSKKVIHQEVTTGTFSFELMISYDADKTQLVTGTYDCERSSLDVSELTFDEKGVESYEAKNASEDEDTCVVTFDENSGKANISLSHQEMITIYGLPYGGYYFVTELTTNGYTVEYIVNSGDIQIGNAVNGTLGDDENHVEFLNVAGYELPTTGGSGVSILVIIGILLLMGPVIYIGYLFYKHERSVNGTPIM